MNSAQTEAVAIVHEGLADVLAWLGETPVTEHEPRHARPYEERTVTRQRVCDAREHEVRYYFPLAA